MPSARHHDGEKGSEEAGDAVGALHEREPRLGSRTTRARPRPCQVTLAFQAQRASESRGHFSRERHPVGRRLVEFLRLCYPRPE